MDIDTLFGLPAHPLVVHAAVVLLPIAAIGLIVVAAIPRARKLYAPMSALVAAEPYVRNRFDRPSPRVVTAVLVGASLIIGSGATYTVIDVGHSGAKSVWNDIGD